jgi:large subunit ribosomal protein L29
MKAKDLRERTDQELSELDAQLRRELFSSRMKNATGQLTDTSQIKKAKRSLARIGLIVSERKKSVAQSAVSQKTGSER